MKQTILWLCATPLAIAGLCLVGYLGWSFSAKVLVVLFWSGVVTSLMALGAVRRRRLLPLGAAMLSWLLLLPVAQAAGAWSVWWVRGFAP